MLTSLQQGTTLVVDRYSYSGIVFTSSKKLPGLDLNWCKVSGPFTHELLTEPSALINAACPSDRAAVMVFVSAVLSY